MKKLGTTLAVIASVAAAAPALADQGSGLSAALRVGYALPMGDAAGGTGGGANVSLSDQLKGGVPLWVDAGYRFNPNMFLGGYFQYAFAFVNSDKALGGGVCNASGVSCSSDVIRLGVEFLYHFLPDATFVPWVGIGTGYEWASLSASQAGVEASYGIHGWEFVNVQVGGDYKLSPHFSVGPYAAFSLGEYGTQSLSAPGVPTTSQDIVNKTVHEWLQFGLKGTFDF